MHKLKFHTVANEYQTDLHKYVDRSDIHLINDFVRIIYLTQIRLLTNTFTTLQ